MNSQKTNTQIGTSKYERKIMLYEPTKDTDAMKCFDGDKIVMVPWRQYWSMRNYPERGRYILINKSDYSTAETLEQAYKDTVEVGAEIRKVTTGLINIHKTGSIKQTTIQLFYDYINGRSHHLFNARYKETAVPEPIDDEEARIINLATTNSMQWSDEYCGPAVKYDVNGFYGWLMSDDHFMVPYCKPEIKEITKEEFNAMTCYPIGIYHVKIEHTKEEHRKLFQLKNACWYTHTMMTYAKENGMKMTILPGRNAMLYGRKNCKTGAQLFGKVMWILENCLKRHKDDRVSKAGKKITAFLWGGLKQSNKMKRVFKPENDEENVIPENANLLSYQRMSNGNWRLEYTIKDQPFKTNWARMAPFLVDRGKVIIAKKYEPYLDNIVRCHTDGFTSKVELGIKHSLDIGGIKVEKTYERVMLTPYLHTIDMTRLDDRREMNKLVVYENKRRAEKMTELETQRKKFIS